MNPRSLFLLLLLPLAAGAFENEFAAYDKAIAKALDAQNAVEEHATALRAHEREYRETFLGHDPWTFRRIAAIQWYAKRGELFAEKERRDIRALLCMSDVAQARRALAAALKPYTDLRAEALKIAADIQRAGKEPSNVRRALLTIRQDLSRIGTGESLDGVARVLDIAITGAKAGQAPELVSMMMANAATCPASRSLVGPLTKLVGDCAMMTAPQRLQTLARAFGPVDKSLQAFRILRGGTRGKSGDASLQRLTNFVELSADLVPVSAIGVKQFLMVQAELMKAIHESVRLLKLELARANLVWLQFAVTTRSVALPHDWKGKHPEEPFGRLAVETSLVAYETEVLAGGEIMLDFTIDRRWTTAWVGIVPAHVPHGLEKDGDAHDVAKRPISGPSGFVSFRAPEQPGTWTVRLYDSDTWRDSGKEVHSVTIQVLSPRARMTLAKRGCYPGDDVTVEFNAPVNWSHQAWIGIVPASVPHGDAETADEHDVDFGYIHGIAKGTMTLRAPEKTGWYEFRMFDDYHGREVMSVPFQVLQPPLGVHLRKKEYAPGDEIVVTFGADPGWSENAWIGIVPSRIPHGDENVNDQHDVDWQYVKGRPSGYMVFKAPETPGSWDFRLHDRDRDGREVASVTFRVVKK
jgi:hypothetical protein